jgi:hypothetical protein
MLTAVNTLSDNTPSLLISVRDGDLRDVDVLRVGDALPCDSWVTHFIPGSCSSFLRRSLFVMSNNVSSAVGDVGPITTSCNISPFGSGDVLSPLGLFRCGEAHVRSAFARVRISRQGQHRCIHIDLGCV